MKRLMVEDDNNVPSDIEILTENDVMEEPVTADGYFEYNVINPNGHTAVASPTASYLTGRRSVCKFCFLLVNR